jgi:ATP-dependent DNA ligase
MDLEGVVAKRKDGAYTPEATTWVKIRCPHYSQGERRRELFEKRRGAVAQIQFGSLDALKCGDCVQSGYQTWASSE